MELVSKISAKSVIGTVEVGSPDFQVFGLARSFAVKNTQYGDSLEFKGNFKAINTATGEQFRSGKMFLPEIAADLLANAISANEGEELEFGFIIGVKEDKDLPKGYRYTVKPLIETTQADPLAALEEKMTKALPNVSGAPKTEAKAKA